MTPLFFCVENHESFGFFRFRAKKKAFRVPTPSGLSGV